MLGLPFEDDLSKKLNEDIFETIYFASMTASKDMAKNVKEQHEIWLVIPSKKGQAHNETSMRTIKLPPKKNLNGWNLEKYKNKWELIESLLK
jgi:hypothetical protein